MSETLDFAPNYAHVIELNVDPSGSTKKWAYALHGITDVTPSSEETIGEDDFYHNLGMEESEVEKIKIKIELSGKREYGDPVQDFVQSLLLKTGSERKTDYRWTMPDGTYLEGRCTILDIVPGGGMGSASDRGEFSYTIAINSVDGSEVGNRVDLPTAVTASDVSVTVGATTSVTASVTPATANQKCHYGIADTSIATVNSDGKVTGVAAGSTKLTIKAASKPSIYKQVDVTVSASVS